MEYRVFGRTGVKVSPIALGTGSFGYRLSEEESKRMLSRAMDAGINILDTGDSYEEGEGESIIGRALAESGRRHEMIIVTKVDHGMRKVAPGPNEIGHSRLNIIRACEASLRRLQTDYIDVYELHRPSPTIPIDEPLGALTDLVRQGKVRYIGSSTFAAWMVMEALMVSELKGYPRFVSEEPPYNLLDRRIENELIPLCQKYGIAIIPWSPIALGVLAGRYHSADPKDFPKDSHAALGGEYYLDRVSVQGVEAGKKFVRLAQEYGILPAHLALLWVKDQPGITAPLIGPRSIKQLEDILPVMEMELDESIRAACDEIVPPGGFVANFHNTSGWMKGRKEFAYTKVMP